jgi:two-component system response regulator HydG
MLELIARVAPSMATVLLQGESGTGKELLASAVHEASRRAEGRFVVVDCSSLPETCSRARSSATSAAPSPAPPRASAGLVEAASGGTLFLDEVGDIPLANAGQVAAPARDRHLPAGRQHRAAHGPISAWSRPRTATWTA